VVGVLRAAQRSGAEQIAFMTELNVLEVNIEARRLLVE